MLNLWSMDIKMLCSMGIKIDYVYQMVHISNSIPNVNYSLMLRGFKIFRKYLGRIKASKHQ